MILPNDQHTKVNIMRKIPLKSLNSYKLEQYTILSHLSARFIKKEFLMSK